MQPRGKSGKLVVISGGTGQLGIHVCRRFFEAGAILVLPTLSKQEQTAFEEAFGSLEDRVKFFPVDALREDQVEAFAQWLDREHGVPAVLVNLAGGYAYGPPVAEAKAGDFQHMLDINLFTTFNLIRALLPAMVEKGGGSIVNTGSQAGLAGSAQHGAYSVAKAAVIRLTESLSAEVRERGLNVNCVLPSIIDTPANRLAMPNADFTQWVAPQDLAEVIYFLASPAARAIHGAALPVTGLV